jgi:hypothetical protein
MERSGPMMSIADWSLLSQFAGGRNFNDEKSGWSPLAEKNLYFVVFPSASGLKYSLAGGDDAASLVNDDAQLSLLCIYTVNRWL